jgi:hypothetical protein
MLKKTDKIAADRKARVVAAAKLKLPPIFWETIIALLVILLLLAAVSEATFGQEAALAGQGFGLALLVALVFIFDQPFKGESSVSSEPIVTVVAEMQSRYLVISAILLVFALRFGFDAAGKRSCFCKDGRTISNGGLKVQVLAGYIDAKSGRQLAGRLICERRRHALDKAGDSSRLGEERSHLEPLANYCSFGATGTDIRPHLRNGRDRRRMTPIDRKAVNTEKRSVTGPANRLPASIPIA